MFKNCKKNSCEITDIAFNTKPISNIFSKKLFFFLKNILEKQKISTKRFKKINIKN